jgi:hypothetical protein
MSVNLPNVFITQFESDVHQVFQSEGFQLKESVRYKSNVVGKTVVFPVMGKGMANQKPFQSDVVPMNVQYTPVSANLEDWVAPEYTDIFAQQKINWDDRFELVKCSGMAIGRRCDQMIIDALAASGTANVIPFVVGVGFTYVTFLSAFRELRRNAATKDIYCVIDAFAEEQLLQQAQLTNAFFVDRKPLTEDGFSKLSIMGVTFIVIPDNLEGGLPLTGNDRTCFMYAKQAMGIGVGIEKRTEINYVPQKTSWLVNSLFSAQSVAVDATGIVEIHIDITA